MRFEIAIPQRLVESYEIATAPVLRGGKVNYGILSFSAELNVYVAFEFDSEMKDEEAVASMFGIEEAL